MTYKDIHKLTQTMTQNYTQLPNYRKITYAELNTHINQHGQKT